MSANPIDNYTVPVDANGVLNTLVKQPYDNTPTEDMGGLRYCEKFKGPYAKTKEVLSYIKVGDQIATIHNVLDFNIGLSEQITYPACPSRNGFSRRWTATSIRVEECDAGAHCYLYIDYSDGIDDSSEDMQADPWQDTWQLTWQAYSVDPFAFCSNGPNQALACSPSFEKDPSASAPGPSWNSTAMRVHIDKYLNSLSDNKTVSGKTYYYYAPDPTMPDSRYFLNDVEASVMKKKQLGRSATYHYPILTHITVKSGGATSSTTPGFPDVVGADLDHIVSLPSGCPYNFPANTWTWVKIGDDMTETKTRSEQRVTFVRRQQYLGSKAVDVNFYGNGTFSHTEAGILSGRWEIEGL